MKYAQYSEEDRIFMVLKSFVVSGYVKIADSCVNLNQNYGFISANRLVTNRYVYQKDLSRGVIRISIDEGV